jgi:general secretion pathway protein I
VRRGGGQGGFTLLEVLVALAILGLAVVASIQGFAQGLRLLKLAGDHQQATLIADMRIREVVTPAEGRQEEVEGDYRWERTITPVQTPELVTASGGVPPWRVFNITVRVVWGNGRQVEVATLRTVSERLVELDQPVGSTSTTGRITTTPSGRSTRP